MALEVPPLRPLIRMRGAQETSTVLDQTYHHNRLQDPALED